MHTEFNFIDIRYSCKLTIDMIGLDIVIMLLDGTVLDRLLACFFCFWSQVGCQKNLC